MQSAHIFRIRTRVVGAGHNQKSWPKFWGGSQGEAKVAKKTNVVKYKTVQNILTIFAETVRVHSQIEQFSKIMKKIYNPAMFKAL